MILYLKNYKVARLVSFSRTVVCCWLFRISTSFRVLRVSKNCSNYFLQPFQPLLFIFNLFQWFHTRNQQKTSANEQKSDIFSTPQRWSKCKSWLTPWKGTSKSSFLVFLKISIFLFFFKHFWVRAAPKSWSKYTTADV